MSSHQSRTDRPTPPRRGVVAVIARGPQFLVIERSNQVVAPGAFCFPGGAIEGEETEEAALVRELQEELGVNIRPIRKLWQSLTPWNVDLSWWLADLAAGLTLEPNPLEVAAVHWLTPAEMLALAGLLESNRSFLSMLADKQIDLEQASQ